MILIVISLLLIILTIIWYLLVKDVIYESFNEEEPNNITSFKQNNKFLKIKKEGQMYLGLRDNYSLFNLKPDDDDSQYIIIKPIEYPDYYLCADDNGVYLTSNLKNNYTRFKPLTIDDQQISLQNKDDKILTVEDDEIILKKMRRRLNKSQLFQPNREN